MPGGDLVKRFGNNSNIGAGFILKTKRNFLFGINGSFLFGNKVKEDSLFKDILTEQGELIDKDGKYAEIRLYERGFTGYAEIGKLFPIFNSNPNSGIFFLAGVGALQHKIRIETPNNNAPQLSPEYRKGYDRFTSGLSVKGFLGYLHLSNNRRVNFFGGVEFAQAWTQNRRGYNFDTMQRDATKRLDNLFGIRIGWVLPLYKKVPDEFYFN
jgi:hypothetical protein